MVVKRRIVSARLGVPENQQGLHLDEIDVFGVVSVKMALMSVVNPFLSPGPGFDVALFLPS